MVGKKYYRYPRSFKLRVGQEITQDVIFPISFIRNEIWFANKIFKELEKHITRENYGKSLVEYFTYSHSRKLDKEKIISSLDILYSTFENQEEVFTREIIQQIVINKIVQKQLESKQETATRDVLNQIKNKWMDLVIPTSSSCFHINKENFERQLSKVNLKNLKPSKVDRSLSCISVAGDTDTSSCYDSGAELLLENNQVNRDLLENALIAHAFDFQNLDITTMQIDVISYKKIKGKSLWFLIKKLLLRDLKPFVFLNKREIGYGIEYTIHENTLQFTGKLTHDLKDNTIVVHLKNSRGRILRELWLRGENKDNRSKSIMEQISESL